MRPQGEPLHALLGAFARELEALEENLEQLYDDQFIETCAEWAAPYIGELIGYRPLHGVAPRVVVAARRGGQHHCLSPAQGHGVHARGAGAQRHGLARARRRILRAARHHAIHESHATARAGHRAVRSQRAMLTRPRPLQFRLAHTVEVRRPGGRAAATTFPMSASSCGACVLTACRRCRWSPIRMTPAGRRMRVNPLGADLRLFRRPTPNRVSRSRRAEERAGSAADSRIRTAGACGHRHHATKWTASDDYGAGRSVVLVARRRGPAAAQRRCRTSRRSRCHAGGAHRRPARCVRRWRQLHRLGPRG